MPEILKYTPEEDIATNSDSMAGTVTIPKEEYQELLKYKNMVNEDPSEELTEKELRAVEEAKKGRFISKEEYLRQKKG